MKTLIIATAIIRQSDKFFIGKRLASKKYAPGKWEFISGFIEEKIPAEDIIIQEIWEELGVKGEIKGNGEPFVFSDNEARWVVIPYLVELNEKESIVSKEHSEMRLVERDELAAYPDLRPFLKDSSINKLINGDSL